MVVGASARLIAIGLAGGLIGAFVTTRFLRGLLASLDPLDPLTFGAATAFLTIVALTASYLPARRAASVDPIVALRVE
jgi:putative ABC transport system permease protein